MPPSYASCRSWCSTSNRLPGTNPPCPFPFLPLESRDDACPCGAARLWRACHTNCAPCTRYKARAQALQPVLLDLLCALASPSSAQSGSRQEAGRAEQWRFAEEKVKLLRTAGRSIFRAYPEIQYFTSYVF